MTQGRLVALVCSVPLVGEALAAALDGVAVVERLPAGGDTAAALRLLRPDALVVDSGEEALAAAPYACEAGVALVHLSPRDRTLRVQRSGRWLSPLSDPSPDAVRSIVLRELNGRGAPA